MERTAEPPMPVVALTKPPMKADQVHTEVDRLIRLRRESISLAAMAKSKMEAYNKSLSVAPPEVLHGIITELEKKLDGQ